MSDLTANFTPDFNTGRTRAAARLPCFIAGRMAAKPETP
jgi:hypothetical protein